MYSAVGGTISQVPCVNIGKETAETEFLYAKRVRMQYVQSSWKHHPEVEERSIE